MERESKEAGADDDELGNCSSAPPRYQIQLTCSMQNVDSCFIVHGMLASFTREDNSSNGMHCNMSNKGWGPMVGGGRGRIVGGGGAVASAGMIPARAEEVKFMLALNVIQFGIQR